jgi:Protein of unknown function (DUF2786)
MTTEAQAYRQRIAAKIQALLKKTTYNGCTEAETLAAAAMANKLMQEYDLTYSDCQDVRSEVEQEAYGARFKVLKTHTVRFVCPAIAKYLNCMYWRENDRKAYVFFGTRDDTETAHNMLIMIMTAMDSEWASWAKRNKKSMTKHAKTVRQSFMAGMVHRLNARIAELSGERETATAQSTALVVMKNQVTASKFQTYAAQTGTQLVKVKADYDKDPRSYNAGAEAAGRIDLGIKKLPKTQILLAERNDKT